MTYTVVMNDVVTCVRGGFLGWCTFTVYAGGIVRIAT